MHALMSLSMAPRVVATLPYGILGQFNLITMVPVVQLAQS